MKYGENQERLDQELKHINWYVLRIRRLKGEEAKTLSRGHMLYHNNKDITEEAVAI